MEIYLIIFTPRFEEWIVSLCRQYGIMLSDYGLPTDSIRLHDIINSRLNNLERLLNELSRLGYFKNIKQELSKYVK